MIGSNGQGKSNLLEGVELLTSLRSHRCSVDRDLIGHGHPWSRLGALTDEAEGADADAALAAIRELVAGKFGEDE